MEAICFIRGCHYVHHRFLNVRPTLTSFTPFKLHNNVSFRSSTVLRASEFNGEPEKIWEPYMKHCLEWVTLSPDLNYEFPEEVRELVPIFSNRGFFLHRLIVQVELLVNESYIPSVKDGSALSLEARDFLQSIIAEFRQIPLEEAENMEMVRNPDIRMVLIFLREKCKTQPELSKVLENNQFLWHPEVILIAYAKMTENAYNNVVYPHLAKLCAALFEMAGDFPENDMAKPTLEEEAAFYVDRQRRTELAIISYKLLRVGYHAKENPLLVIFSLGLHHSRQDCKSYINRLFSFMEDFNALLDEINPMVVKEDTIAIELERKTAILYHLVTIARIAGKWSTSKVVGPLDPDAMDRRFSNLFLRDMALVMGQTFIRCKIFLEEFKKTF